MSATTEHDVPDILEALTRDHRRAEKLLGSFDRPAVGRREDWFCHLREELVRHEVAEEIAVYPVVRHVGDPGKEVLDDRLEEQASAEQILSDMEKMALESEEFAAAFAGLRRAVLDHAQAEERTVFPAIEAHRSFEQRRMMSQRYERAKSAAPTHPHPHAPDRPPGNIVLGPIAKLADKIRDAMRNDDDQSHMSDPHVEVGGTYTGPHEDGGPVAW